jgi:hypothetical protein
MAGLPDFNSSEEKRARFGKVFAPRVEKLIEDLQAVAKTANLEIYEFDDALVKKLFVELARRFRATAHRFGIEFEITVEGEAITEVEGVANPGHSGGACGNAVTNIMGLEPDALIVSGIVRISR